MACGDYILCEVCGNKALYDGNVQYDGFSGVVAALCGGCQKDYLLMSVSKKAVKKAKDNEL